MKTVAKNTGLLTLAFILMSLVGNAGETEWWSAEEIGSGYQVQEMDVLDDGYVYVIARDHNLTPESTIIVRRKVGSGTFETFWLPSAPPMGPSFSRIGLASYKSTLFLRGAFGDYRFNDDGSVTNIMCIDAYSPHWFVPIDEQTLYIYGAWRIEGDSSDYMRKVVHTSLNDTLCIDEYAVPSRMGHGFVSCVAANDDGKPFITFRSRPLLRNPDTLIREQGGKAVLIKGFNDARYYDALFISKESFGWIVALDPIGAVDKPELLLKLDSDFSIISSIVLPGDDQDIQSVKSDNGRIVVCQRQIVGVFDLERNTWTTLKTFEDVVGRKPLHSLENMFSADINGQDLFVCYQSGIRVFRDAVTSVIDTPLSQKPETLAVFANQEGSVQTQLPDGQHDIVVCSVLGQKYTFSTIVQSGNLRLNSACLWNGLNVVQVGQEKHCVLYIP